MLCATRHRSWKFIRFSYSVIVDETPQIEMMLGTVTREMELSTINIESLSGEFNIDLSITKVAKSELLHVDNPKYEQFISTYPHLNGCQ
jgi:hypothetical protein